MTFLMRKLLRCGARSFFGAFLLLLSSASVFGQTTAARPDRGTNPAGAYAISDIENINLQNGNVGLSIPLASLPPIAGGKLSWTISAHYNSKLWNVLRREDVAPGTIGYQSYVVDTPQQSDRGGWSVGGSYNIIFRDATDDFWYNVPFYDTTQNGEWQQLQYNWKKVILVTPDGAEHELRPSDSAIAYNSMGSGRDYLNMYFRETPETRNAPMRYHSLDGTFLSVLINPNASADPAKWTIFLPDGNEVIQYKNGIQRIKDTNGNSIKLYGTQESNYAITSHYQDEQTGREITVFFNSSASNGYGQYQVSYPTVGGGTAHVDVNMGETVVRGKIYDFNTWNSSSYNEDGTSGMQCKVQQQLIQYLPVVRSIVFPQTEPGIAAPQYTFSYNSDGATETATDTHVRETCSMTPGIYTRQASHGMGDLSRIVTPVQATIDYTYSNDGVHSFVGWQTLRSADDMTTEVVKTKTVKDQNNNVLGAWTYDIPTGGFATASEVASSDGSSTVENYYPTDTRFNMAMSGAGAGMGGLVYRTIQSGKVVTDKHWVLLSPTGQGIPGTGMPVDTLVSVNPVVDAEYTSLLDESGNLVKTSAKTYQHDYNGNVTQTKEYDWFDAALVQRGGDGVPTGVPSGATLLRESNTVYYNSAPDLSSPNLYQVRSLVSGTPLFLSAVKESSTGTSNTHISYDNQSFGAAPTLGNPTKVSQWDSANNRWNDVSFGYDAYGNKTTTIDANGHTTQAVYGDATHAAPTSVTVDPLNGTGQQTATIVYDPSTGLVTSQIDANGNTATIDYTNQLLGAVDPLNRPGGATSPAVVVNGTSQHHKVTTTYEDHLRRATVASDLNAENDGLLKSRTTGDVLGRSVLAEQSENGSSYTISSQTVYEQAGRVTYASNPSRGDVASTATDGWSRSTTDTLGRVIEVATFGGTTKPPASGVNGNFTGKVVSSYDVNTTTVADQAGKTRKSVSDGLGRLVQIIEDPGTAPHLNYQTNYEYDALGNLRTVQQGVQTRTFIYDSLSRLSSAANPESGTIAYSYDGNGNLLTKTDARGVVSTYAYDGLNRATTRSYSDSITPTVTYAYDTLANGKGKLSSVSSSVSATSYAGYDALGRMTGSSQTTNGAPLAYVMSYGYDLAGHLKSETYPSGRVITNSYDNAGREQSVTGQMSGVSKPYASQFSYAAHGGINAMQLGNNLWEHSSFNSRLQPIQIGLGTQSTNSTALQLDYSYGTTSNNGNVQSQTITAPGLTLAQSYTYDELNRLETAQEMSGATQTWKQAFLYDRYGNRNFKAGTTTTDIDSHVTNPTISAANNQIDANASQQGNILYDAAGNLTKDISGFAYGYDGENKQTTYAGGGTVNGGASYYYDGDGHRVKKIYGNTTTIFVYDASGQMVAEYSTDGAQANGTSYLTADNLGTPRVITDQSGGVKARHDYLPFGEELGAGVGGRTQQQGYVGDNVRQKFTGQERDDETGLDFMQARYYASTQGRFTSVDPLMASASTSRPQSWNRYSYAYNNPLRFTDPSGMIAGDFYNQDGKRLGTDGIDDGKVYVVTDKNQSKQIEQANKKGGMTQVGSVSSAVELPSANVRGAIGAAVDRSNSPTADDKKGGFHEEGLIAGPALAGGQETVVNAAPGAYSDPRVDTKATIDVSNPANPAQAGILADITVSAHVHPSGVLSSTSGPSSGGGTTVFGGTVTTSRTDFNQPPSAVDIQYAGSLGSGVTNIVAGARSKTVYIYNGSGVRATFPLKQFLSIGRK